MSPFGDKSLLPHSQVSTRALRERLHDVTSRARQVEITGSAVNYVVTSKSMIQSAVKQKNYVRSKKQIKTKQTN